LSPTRGELHLVGVRKALRLLFHRRGELARLDLAELLLADDLEAAGFSEFFAETMAAMEVCRRMRNMLAHCHFATLQHDQPTDGLFLVSLEKAVKGKTEKIEYDWQRAFYPRLRGIERHLEYTASCLDYIDSEMWTKRGRQSPRPTSTPTKVPLPPEHVPASPDEVAILPKEI
jgi:hypothetical protein